MHYIMKLVMWYTISIINFSLIRMILIVILAFNPTEVIFTIR